MSTLRAEQTKRYNPTQKFIHSAPIPLEPDSDPDFNPGEYVPEPSKNAKKGKGKGKGKAATNVAPLRRGRKRKGEDLAEEEYGPRPRKAARTARALGSQNPLTEFFGDMGLHSASEDEGEADDEDGEFDDDDDDNGSHHEDEDNEPPVVLKTLAALTSRSATPPKTDAKGASDEESVTEPETDEEVRAAFQSSTRTPPRRASSHRAKSADAEESVTEQSDADAPPISTGTQKRVIFSPSRSAKKTPVEDSDSVTESETEPETDQEIDTSELEPRPAFALKPGQPTLSSLVLDINHKVPGKINTFLREYQREGVRFFWERYKAGKGGLLGDDMGLGKTIQVISFLSAIMQKHGDTRDLVRRRKHVSLLQDLTTDWKERRVLPPANQTWPTCLIIAPSSVVGNWEREFETWGYFEVGTYLGVPGQRADVLRDFKMGRLDVVLTSFDVARRDIDLLDDLAWSCIIVDEVHRVKNPRSKLTAAFSQFQCTTRFGLTGTAIQNSYLELWTILNWTNPGAVGTKGQWEGYVVRPLTVGQSKSASDEEHMKAALVAKILAEKLLPKFFLRRTKFIIKDQLPKKIDEVVFCPLTKTQINVYKRILSTQAVQNMIFKDELCDCGSRKTRKKCCHSFEKGDLFKYMSTLIKISNHLALILPSPSDTAEQTARNREMSQFAFGQDQIPMYGQAVVSSQCCGKWLVLESLLKEWRKDRSNKVLIFTKSVKLIEMLDFHLRSQNLGFVKLDGSTKQSDRMSVIDKFHEDPDVIVFLISTLAGGTGLNLTGANKVVIFDPNWNPAHDLQAMDRAYRFGQTRDVSVYRLLGAGSIEELIYARQVYKQQQMLVGYNASFQTRYFEGVQGEKGKQGELFGIKNIFKLYENTLATKMAIERATVIDLDWALTHMVAKGKTNSPRRKDADWVYEAEAKSNKEDGELRGLGALLFDDNPPEIDKDTLIQKTLNVAGVNYTHRNEDLIAESTVEVQRMRMLLEEQKKERKKAKARRKDAAASKAPEPEWPPKRRHHKPLPTPEEKLLHRRVALIELGMIRNQHEVPVFARQFVQKSADEQNAILAQLDDYARRTQGPA